MSTGSPGFILRRVDFCDLPGWTEDDPRTLFEGMRNCQAYDQTVKSYRTGSLGLAYEDMRPVCDALPPEGIDDPVAARSFFERQFRPFRICRKDGKSGFVTAFYEPEVEVSSVPSAIWAYPFYHRPPDLVSLDVSNRPTGMDPTCVFGRLQHGDITEYPDRRIIDCGYLQGKGLEIAWAKSKVEVFFAHVQGAARLRFTDGSVRRITYAAKSGHLFSAIGRLLIDLGEIEEESVSMQSIRGWLERNPDRVDEILWHNRSYIFFREAEVRDSRLGPIAAAKVPLLPGRSLAIDRQIHTFGFPFFIHSPTLRHLDQGRTFARTMLALDTGSAIIGPARGDIFTGSGDTAGVLAGAVRNDADFYVFVPAAAATRFER